MRKTRNEGLEEINRLLRPYFEAEMKSQIELWRIMETDGFYARLKRNLDKHGKELVPVR